MRRVADLAFAFLYVQVHRLLRDTLHEDAVETGAAHGRTECAAGIGIVPAVVDRRFAHDGVASAHQAGRAVHSAADKADHALGRKRIGVRRHLVVQDACAETVAADPCACKLLVELANLGRTLRQVDEQQFSRISFHMPSL